MADKVKLIKEEIESYKESMKGLEPHSDFRRGQITAYNQIMQFIDSLPEEHNELKKDYRERYEKLSQSDNFKQAYCNKSLGSEEHNEDLEEAASKYVREDFHERSRADFKAGAEWQKQQMKEALQTEYEKGRFDMREEMMKDALSGQIYRSHDGDVKILAVKGNTDKLYRGTDIKFIILKPE